MDQINKFSDFLKSEEVYSHLTVDDFNIIELDFEWIAIGKNTGFNVGVLTIVIPKYGMQVFAISSATGFSKEDGISGDYLLRIRSNGVTNASIVKIIKDHCNLTFQQIHKRVFDEENGCYFYIWNPLELRRKLQKLKVDITMIRPDDKGIYPN